MHATPALLHLFLSAAGVKSRERTTIRGVRSGPETWTSQHQAGPDQENVLGSVKLVPLSAAGSSLGPAGELSRSENAVVTILIQLNTPEAAPYSQSFPVSGC